MQGHIILSSSPDLAWLSQDKHNSASNYGLFGRNWQFGLFWNFGRIVVRSSLSLTLGFSKTFCFPSSLEGFFRGPGRTYPATPFNVLVGLRRPNIVGEIFCLSTIILKTYLTTATLAKPWTAFMLKMLCPKGRLCPKPLPPLWKRWA